ncbi:hypothetical protein GQ44DRAFT_689781 [Phaeosphaeriaceae sp. PMI808]|nr:hypothetical protein GQ44DRAFT_689781 [Phaeosphaeriaceae sp. PMI808]
MPIAIIGIGCRFPGEATSGEELFEFLLKKRSARTEVPSDRYNVNAFYHPDGDHYGTTNNSAGHYLTEDVALFDAPFFSISPAEAMAMDPMQRMLLEVTYEALENSGSTLQKVSGSKTSCFIGCFTKDYEEMQRRDMELAPKYQSTGASQTMLSNRLSYFFNFKGPSVTLDTACSSGLVAVHLACQGLQTGESSMAVVGGSNLMLSPDIQIEMSDMHFLSPDSISYAFDERANGYARGEGVGAVVLKPLDLALRDNDPIRAIIRGTAASSDGRTPGITMPSREAQIDLIRSAYRAAGCDVGETGYFEAHGTGTAAGDPIETSAIGAIFAPHRPLAANGEPIPLSVGSLKTNIGHLEGASGIAGLIKATLTVERGIIAPNIHYRKGNPAIDFENWRIQVPTEAIPWPWEGVRRASVNSFGYGGTNAHVIVEDAFLYLQQNHCSKTRNRTDSTLVALPEKLSHIAGPRLRMYLLSAHDERGLRLMGDMLLDYIQAQSDIDEEDLMDRLAYTLSQRRSKLTHICSFIASCKSELEELLRKTLPVSISRTAPCRIGYIFTGQGASWAGMGKELLSYSTFKTSIQQCEAYLHKLGCQWSLVEELLKTKSNSRLTESAISQPLCTALQIALVDLLSSWNVLPNSVVGHSSGEIAAAYTVGAITIEAAMTVAFFRGALASKVKKLGYRGSMMAVGLSEEDVREEIARLNNKCGEVMVACINSPRGVTVSGDDAAVGQLQKVIATSGAFVKVLPGVDIAYHSHHMQAIAEEYLERLREANVVAYKAEKGIQMFSSVTGQIVEHNQLGAEYWVANLVGCVNFSGAIQKLCLPREDNEEQAVDILLEIGPHALLKLPVQETLHTLFGDKSSIRYLPILVRNKPADATALQAAGALHTENVPIDILAANFPLNSRKYPQVLTNLPRYPWNHTRSYWYESRLSRDYRFRQSARTETLGASVPDWNPLEPRFRNFLRLREQPWLRDHIVQGDVLFPACGYICMAIEGCRQLLSKRLAEGEHGKLEYRLREVRISRALLVPDSAEGVETCLSLRSSLSTTSPSLVSWQEFRIFSYTVSVGWVENCRGLVAGVTKLHDDQELATECQQELASMYTESAQKIDPKRFYQEANTIGLTYGPLFQGLIDITINTEKPGRAAGVIEVTNTRVRNPKEHEHDRIIHPATMDNFLQAALVALGGVGLNDLTTAMVPTYVEEICISANVNAQIGDRLNVVVSTGKLGTREAIANIIALDPVSCQPVVLMDGFKFVAINDATSLSARAKLVARHCYKPIWEPDVQLISPQNLNRELRAAPSISRDLPKSVRELELLAYYFIDLALQKISEHEIPTMLPHHQKFYRNLCELRDAVIARTHPQQTAEWQHLHTPEVAFKLSKLVEYYRDHETAFDGKLLVRVGEALPLVFRQEVEPLTLMTHENLLEAYYTTAVGMPNTYAQISRYVNMLSHKYPNLDYLEIGAGTGGATVPTLQGLGGCDGLHKHPRLKSYTYTDISSYFFQRAAKKFEDFASFMHFKKLDIEVDPEIQEFKAASYNVIVAANVLHATSDIHQTMAHVRKLLKTGGTLILLEMTNRLLAASVIFGTLPGWWNASEEWRTGGPLLTEAQWQDMLFATGFGKLQASSADVLEPLEEGTRLMIASAIEPRMSLRNGLLTPPETPHVLILCADSPIKIQRSIEAAMLLETMTKSGIQAQMLPLSLLPKQDVMGAVCISLVELEEPLLACLSPIHLRALQSIADQSAGLIWVTRGASSSYVDRPDLGMFQGLSRTLRAEYENLRCVSIDFSSENRSSANGVADVIYRVYEKLLGSGHYPCLPDSEFFEQDGVLYVKRCIEDDQSNAFLAARSDPASLPPQSEKLSQKDKPLRLNLLESMRREKYVWEQAFDMLYPLKPTEVDIQIQASSLDITGVQIIKGDHSSQQPTNECSGIVVGIGTGVEHLSIGDRVVTWCLNSFSTHTRTHAMFVHKIPASIDFETAATLPLAYVTAWFSLIHTGRLDAGDRVLIHDAANPVGESAVHIATLASTEIFATVRTDEQKDYFAKKYGINQSHIFSTQHTGFVSAIRRLTKGYGLDVVLNTFSGEMLQSSFSCIAPFGRFLDLRKSNAQTNERLEMAPFAKNASFTSIDIDFLYQKNAKIAGVIFQNAMDFALEHEAKAFPVISVHPWSELAQAIDLVQDDNQLGKFVMRVEVEDSVLVTQNPPPLVSLDPAASYLVAGGFGGLGRSISHWLLEHGARNLIFVSRSGASQPSASTFLTEIQTYGAHIAVLQCDISDYASLLAALDSTLKDFPPIKGVLQAAMTLNDALFSNMTSEKWNDAIRAKVYGSKNLHEATIDQPLDFFILLSSLHGFIGNPGQSNYAAGCAYQVALAKYRNGLNLPAVAIDLGIVADVGYVVEKEGDGKKVNVHDFKRINETELLALIELGIRKPDLGHLITGLSSNFDTLGWEDNAPFFARDPILSHLEYLRPHLQKRNTHLAISESSTYSVALSLSAQIAASTSLEQTHNAIQIALVKKLSCSLMMDSEEIDESRPMSAYGTDSLVAVDMKNWIQRETEVLVSVFDILQSGSIAELVGRITQRVIGEK